MSETLGTIIPSLEHAYLQHQKLDHKYFKYQHRSLKFISKYSKTKLIIYKFQSHLMKVISKSDFQSEQIKKGYTKDAEVEKNLILLLSKVN